MLLEQSLSLSLTTHTFSLTLSFTLSLSLSLSLSSFLSPSHSLSLSPPQPRQPHLLLSSHQPLGSANVHALFTRTSAGYLKRFREADLGGGGGEREREGGRERLKESVRENVCVVRERERLLKEHFVFLLIPKRPQKVPNVRW